MVLGVRLTIWRRSYLTYTGKKNQQNKIPKHLKWHRIIMFLGPRHFYWSDCTKPRKWAVMYLSVRSINFDSTIFLLEFGIVQTLWYLLFFIFINTPFFYIGFLVMCLFCKWYRNNKQFKKKKTGWELVLYAYYFAMHFLLRDRFSMLRKTLEIIRAIQ